MTKPKKILIVTHFTKDDEDCGGDYYDIEVFVDGKLAAEYGDYYHDKGSEKAEAFVDGVNFICGANIVPQERSVADRD